MARDDGVLDERPITEMLEDALTVAGEPPTHVLVPLDNVVRAHLASYRERLLLAFFPNEDHGEIVKLAPDGQLVVVGTPFHMADLYGDDALEAARRTVEAVPLFEEEDTEAVDHWSRTPEETAGHAHPGDLPKDDPRCEMCGEPWYEPGFCDELGLRDAEA